jgi:hypothetical protein
MSQANIDDLAEQIQSKLWAADNLITQVKTLAERADSLDPAAKRNIPQYRGDWSAIGVATFVEKYGESIRNPIRHKNKTMLEDLRIRTSEVSEEILEDTSGVLDCVSSVKALDPSSKIVNFLIERGILADWMRRGFSVANEGLRHVSIARTALNNIIESCPNALLRDELLSKSIMDPNFIDDANDIVTKVNFVSEFGILLPPTLILEEFHLELDEVSRVLNELVDEHEIKKSDLDQLLKAKNLRETREILSTKKEENRRMSDQLFQEWTMYAEILRSVGQAVPEAPARVSELRSGVEVLRTSCLDKLGKNGMTILTYLRGEGEFPIDLAIEDLKRTIQVLRPVFIKSLKAERSVASS